jgi:undecaprenyl-diphosphatase
MNAFDQAITEFIANFFDRSGHTLDAILFISHTNLLKGFMFAVLVWYLWFKVGEVSLDKRVQLLATLISVFFVIAASLCLTRLVPFRQRPFTNPDFHFNYSVPMSFYLRRMSSFPSDHASVFISLATGFFFVSPKIGRMVILYTLLIILFPRLYLGYHYPTDLLAGAVIGASITTFFNRSATVRNMISKWIIPLVNHYPGYFYSLLFVVTYEIAETFEGSKEILIALYGLVKRVL